MMTIQLYGHLRQRFGKTFNFHVTSPAEALRALMANLPGFDAHLIRHNTPGYKIIADQGAPRTLDTLYQPAAKIIKIIPVVRGSGKGVTSILIGVALVGIGVATGGFGLSLSAAWAGGMSTTLGYFSSMIGAALILGGVAQMLSPQTRTKEYESAKDAPGYMFSGAVNTSAQGNPVAICYGRLRVGSQIISTGISTGHIADTLPPPPPGSDNASVYCVEYDDQGGCIAWSN